MKKIITVTIFLLLTSCANYINGIHRDLDKQEYAQKQKRRQGGDHFQQFRKGTPTRNPMDTGRYSSRTRRSLSPKVKRYYRPATAAKKRMKANDLNDQGNYSSLWSGNGNENYLFSFDESRKNGDIILINVFSRLKSEITLELKKAFPPMPIAKKLPDDSEEGDKKDKTAKAAPKKAPESKDKQEAYDRITSVIVEKINNQHILVRGRKHLLFNNRKRLVEVQALVSERDITTQDTIDSDKILESTVNIIR